MLASSDNSRMLLLCAGQTKNDSEITNALEQLKRRGTAPVLNRFVSDTEEKLCFCASDVVLLPYVKHFGSSGVVSVSTVAGKMVIVSDEGLIARRVREHKLGWLFASGNVRALKERMEQTTSLPLQDRPRFQESALEYSRTCSRNAHAKSRIHSHLAVFAVCSLLFEPLFFALLSLFPDVLGFPLRSNNQQFYPVKSLRAI